MDETELPEKHVKEPEYPVRPAEAGFQLWAASGPSVGCPRGSSVCGGRSFHRYLCGLLVQAS